MSVMFRNASGGDIDYIVRAEHTHDNRMWILPWSREQHERALNDPDLAYVVVVQGGEPVGYLILAGLTHRQHSVEFKRLVVTAKGKGLGRRAVQYVKRVAFEDWHTHRLWLDVKSDNQRAQQLYLSEGFTREGELRDCLPTENGYESLVIMSILRREHQETTSENGERGRETEGNSGDERFLREVRSTIEQNMMEDAFSVQALADEIGLSRRQLYRRLMVISTHSPSALIRKVRLCRARQLLEKRAGTVTQVAYGVGFSSPAYFAKCFRERFGISPREYVRRANR